MVDRIKRVKYSGRQAVRRSGCSETSSGDRAGSRQTAPGAVLLQAVLSVGQAGRLPAVRAGPPLSGSFTWGVPGLAAGEWAAPHP